MNAAIILRKLAAITAGLALAATASTGHAQQKVAEEMLERQLQQQQLAGESGKESTEQKHEKDAEHPKIDVPKDIDLSILYDDEGNAII